MSTYWQKLRDPRWQKLRLEVMGRDNFTCLACGDVETTLNVHHLKYHGEPWEAPMAELETLCEPCHEIRTKLNKTLTSAKTKTLFFIRDCADKWIKHSQQVAPPVVKRFLTPSAIIAAAPGLMLCSHIQSRAVGICRPGGPGNRYADAIEAQREAVITCLQARDFERFRAFCAEEHAKAGTEAPF